MYSLTRERRASVSFGDLEYNQLRLFLARFMLRVERQITKEFGSLELVRALDWDILETVLPNDNTNQIPGGHPALVVQLEVVDSITMLPMEQFPHHIIVDSENIFFTRYGEFYSPSSNPQMNLVEVIAKNLKEQEDERRQKEKE
jgi:hypothetical protein